MNKPTNVSELYPSPWLRAADLPRPVMVRIVGVEVQEFRQPDGSQKAAAVIAFAGAKKRLIANKTQCAALAKLTGSERFTDWIGRSVVLSPGTAPNGKATIVVSAATNGNGKEVTSNE